MITKWMLRWIPQIIVLAIIVGIVLPSLFSAKSTIAVSLGVVLLFAVLLYVGKIIQDTLSKFVGKDEDSEKQ